MDLIWLGVAALAGLAGGFVNTLAGGGSMVMVPALMLAGLPASAANATSRVPIFAQCFTSAAAFARAGRLERGPALDVAPLAVLGAIAGAYVATLLPDAIFQPLLVGTMIVMAIGMLVRPDALASTPDGSPRRVMGRPLFMLITLSAGFYGGVLQAGAGLVFLALLSGLLRYDLVRANALKAVVMLAYISVTVVIFALGDLIHWDIALAMTCGAVLGAWFGAKFALGRGQAWIRWIVVAVVISTCVIVLLR